MLAFFHSFQKLNFYFYFCGFICSSDYFSLLWSGMKSAILYVYYSIMWSLNYHIYLGVDFFNLFNLRYEWTFYPMYQCQILCWVWHFFLLFRICNWLVRCTLFSLKDISIFLWTIKRVSLPFHLFPRLHVFFIHLQSKFVNLLCLFFTLR